MRCGGFGTALGGNRELAGVPHGEAAPEVEVAHGAQRVAGLCRHRRHATAAVRVGQQRRGQRVQQAVHVCARERERLRRAQLAERCGGVVRQ